MRTFIAVHLNQEAIDDLTNMQKYLKGNNVKARYTPEDNFHITLKFLGEIEYADIQRIYDALKDKFTDIKPFYIRLNKVGYFPGDKNIRVLWAGVSDKKRGLNALYNVINRELSGIGYSEDKRPFRSHVTIAREVEKNSEIIKVIKGYKFTSGEFLIDRISLMDSRIDGNKRVYTPLFDIRL
ncbi:2'-5' RNA ligase [Caldanaerobius fijiensis DSM 17918]|uniref:RNA 2',3'-cyclic phosphodiesterase n=1 Tax=Caldanaerobius fijiensis DSM 17918 TaxID=1121256 RepID=A0A1M5F5K1_9THEO|nr:RNA 2',3'-cyclic phosphodiesterase [Caldanaerobius fijiensis]SHF86797.1 2'-5' RNA ligase [Caldanaerobius fijiensis DSM 17918]